MCAVCPLTLKQFISIDDVKKKEKLPFIAWKTRRKIVVRKLKAFHKQIKVFIKHVIKKMKMKMKHFEFVRLKAYD